MTENATTEKIAIIGSGNVGSALEEGLAAGGHDVRVAEHDRDAVRDVSDWADVVILAVPYPAVADVVETAGSHWAGKTVVDVTNALTEDMSLALGYDTSGAEELQAKVPDARVVKAFNTVFAQHMATGRLDDEPLTALVAGDDADAKAVTLDLARSIGFDAVDAGPLANARLLEPLGYLNIQLGFTQGLGTDIGFKLTGMHVPATA